MPCARLAVVVALGALALSLSGQVPAIGWVVAAASLVAIALAARRLLPPRTLRAGRGLPSVVLMRGLIAGTLFGAEIYVPYLLIDHYDFSPTLGRAGADGGGPRVGAFADVQGRFGDRLGNRRITLIGITLLATSTTIACATALLGLPPGC